MLSILFGDEIKTTLLIKANRILVGINSDKTTARSIAMCEHVLDQTYDVSA